MPGLLDNPDALQAFGLLGQGIASRNVPAFANQAMSLLAGADQRRIQQAMQQMQMRQMQMGVDREQRALEMDGALRQAAKDSFLTPERATALSMGPMPDGSNMPMVQPGFDMSGYVNRVMQIDPTKGIGLQQAMQKDDTPIPVAPGASLYSKKQNRVLFTAPDKADKLPAEVQAYEYARGQGYQGTYEQWDRERKRAGATSITVQPDNLGLKPKDRFEMEGQLAGDYNKAVDQDRKLISAAGKVKTALSQDGALKDTAAIYGFAKALDPEGAVRESDYAAVANTAGMIDRVRGYANKLLTGEKLTPAQRQEMETLATAWQRVAEKRIAAQRNRYTEQAKRYNLEPKAVLDPGSPGDGWGIREVKK